MADDPIRVLTIERDRTLPPRELLDRIEADAPSATPAAFAELDRRRRSPVAASIRGRGEMTVDEILERFVVVHAEEHVVQLGAALAEAGGRALDPEIGCRSSVGRSRYRPGICLFRSGSGVRHLIGPLGTR